MSTALLITTLMLQISFHTAVPVPEPIFNKFFPQKTTTAPILPFAGIINSLAGVLPSANNVLGPGLSSGLTPGLSLGTPQAGQSSATFPGQALTSGVSGTVSSPPVFPIPGITAPLFPGLPGILSSLTQSTPVSQAPGTVSGTPGSTPGTIPGSGPATTIPGIIPAITAPLIPGLNALISGLQTPIINPVMSTSNGTTVPLTTLVSDQLKSQLNAAKITYIKNGLAYGIALAQQVITGFFQGLLTPMTTTASNIG